MRDEPKALKEVHEWREKIYEETKNMTPSESTKHTKDAAEEFIKKHNLKVIYVNETTPEE